MSEKLEIITNNHRREVVYGFELTDKERKKFDYYNDEQINELVFFRYKGEVYELGEFMVTSGKLKKAGWDGFRSDSFFSGLAIRYPSDDEQRDFDHVIVALVLV